MSGRTAGGLVGAAAYMLTYASIGDTALLDKIAGGEATLGPIAGTNYPALFGAISGEWLGLAVGVLLVVIAWLLPARIGAARKQPMPAE